MQYNLCNEPWLKYSMQVIADRGLKPSQLTSARLHEEVLYLETTRYARSPVLCILPSSPPCPALHMLCVAVSGMRSLWRIDRCQESSLTQTR